MFWFCYPSHFPFPFKIIYEKLWAVKWLKSQHKLVTLYWVDKFVWQTRLNKHSICKESSAIYLMSRVCCCCFYIIRCWYSFIHSFSKYFSCIPVGKSVIEVLSFNASDYVVLFRSTLLLLLLLLLMLRCLGILLLNLFQLFFFLEWKYSNINTNVLFSNCIFIWKRDTGWKQRKKERKN